MVPGIDKRRNLRRVFHGKPVGTCVFLSGLKVKCDKLVLHVKIRAFLYWLMDDVFTSTFVSWLI